MQTLTRNPAPFRNRNPAWSTLPERRGGADEKTQFTEETDCLSPEAAEPDTITMEPDVRHKLGISDVLFDGAGCVS